MPSKCCCAVYAKDATYKLFRIPAVCSRAAGEERAYPQLKRLRCDSSRTAVSPPSTTLLVCGRHFHSGKPAKFQETRSVDWVPTLNLPREGSIDFVDVDGFAP